MQQPDGKRVRGLAVAACAAVFGLTACLDHELPPGEDADGQDVFIALQRDFADFQDWPAFDLGTLEHADVEGQVVVYLERLPPRDAEVWPVGTRIVKTVELGEPTSWVIHAMVKRGGDFNAGGALGWEYFELVLDAEGTPVLRWRGEAPPTPGSYLPTPGLATDADEEEPDCNGCHAATNDNDHVLSEPLRLEALR